MQRVLTLRDRRLRLYRKLRVWLKKHNIRDAPDTLTAREFGKRDRFVMENLGCKNLRFLGVRANHVTYFGFLLVTAFNILIALGYAKLAFTVGAVGILTDAVDGPMARWKDPRTGQDDVTGWGTFLDHFRDFSFAFSFGLNAFFRFGTTNAHEIVLATLVFLSYAGILVTIGFRYQMFAVPRLSHFTEKFSHEYWRGFADRFNRFALEELQTTFRGRVQFFLLISGVIILFIGKYVEIAFLTHFAYTVLGGEVTAGFFNMLDMFENDEEEFA